MKLLLITDTHGHLDQIDALATRSNCIAIIHAGDFGFYDEQSPERLSERELNLQITHSEIPMNEKKEVLSFSLEKRLSFIRERLPLSQLPQYVNGEKQFRIPMYAVWGNHEDAEVVKKFYSGEYTIPNLHVLHDKNSFLVGGCHIFGIGGNLLLSQKFFQKPIAGGGGKIWSTLSQYLDLIDAAQSREVENDIRILVSHVSPGKEAFVSLVGACVGASFIISGHMGPPFTMCWNEFAIFSPEESTLRLERCVTEVCSLAEQVDQTARECASRLKDYFERCQGKTVFMGRRATVPRWYRDMIYVNLSDFDAGYAVLAVENGSISLETISTRGRMQRAWRTHDPDDA
jgi:predicted phosphodiesterase